MNRTIIIPARNEGQWADITAANFKAQFPDSHIIGVDDGGVNVWPKDIQVIKTAGGIGVGNCRRLGVSAAKTELICITDAHVIFDCGDKEKAWRLAKDGNVVTFTSKSLKSGKNHGNGRFHYLPTHKTANVHVKEGAEIGLIGGVYFMRKDVAVNLIAPTASHGFNEEIMTTAAFAFGHPIYTLPGMVFQHLYKKEFNYDVTYNQQQQNRKLLDWWFFDGTLPAPVTKEQQAYYIHVQKNRVLNKTELISKFEKMLTLETFKTKDL